MEKILKKTSTSKEVKAKLLKLYDELFKHDGYGEIKVDIRILRRGQKEIIIHCGKQYRFVVDSVPQKSSQLTPNSFAPAQGILNPQLAVVGLRQEEKGNT